MIPYGRQDITEADVDAVVDVLRSDFLTQGPSVDAFERAVAQRVGAAHAVGVNSATSALHLACLALGVGPGDLVWTVPNTFVASANCARYCGADVGFVDIESDTWNIDPVDFEARLAAAAAAERLPKVVIPVHFGGQPPDMAALAASARRHGVKIVEDASHAIGASVSGEPVGSGRWSDITVFSFHPVKIITTAEGGMAVTNDPILMDRLTLLRSHGIVRDRSRLRSSALAGQGWYYEQQTLGFNYRLTDIQARLGESQLSRLEAYVERRNALAERYNSLLMDLPIVRPAVRAGHRSSWHLYVVRVPRRDAVYQAMRSAGIGVNVHYWPVHLQPYYRDLGFGPGDCPVAEAYGAEALTLPLYPSMSETDQDYVADALRKALAHVG